KLAQHPTTYKHHRHSDPIVLDSYEWVLLLKNGNINQCEDSFNSILIASRLIVVIAFIFIVLSFYAL
ncbi:hypothetical protein HMPREF1423_01481, partial [Helicobacter pylori GAM270ASi]|uniref:hypothetical protein n=1 Tax=Helicobacter pylori TaxID=210 RepID=UPI0002BA7CDF